MPDVPGRWERLVSPLCDLAARCSSRAHELDADMSRRDTIPLLTAE